MDGENKGSKPYEQMDDLGGFHSPYFWKHPYSITHLCLLQGGPLLVINGVVTPINSLINR